MKSLKKIGALLLALTLVMGLGVSAFAANGVNTNATTSTTMDIPITQTLYFKNAEGSAVYEPNLYYTYTITPGEAGQTVTDHAGVTATVKAGDMRAFGIAADAASQVKEFGINFSSDHKTVAANAEGTSAVTKKVTVTFNGAALVSADGVVTPGVYRYIITSTLDATAKNAQGVEEVGPQDKTLVLDITVDASGNVVGSAIQDPSGGDNPAVDNSEDADNDGVEDDTTDVEDDETGKVTGFGDPDDPDDPTNPFEDENPKDTTGDDPTKPDTNVDPEDQQTKATTASDLPDFYDMYTTYNVTVTKAVTGTMGDKSNFFPFQLDISNSIAGAAFSYTVTDNGSKNVGDTAAVKAQLIKTAGTKTLGSASATVANGFEIKDGGKINLIGVPSIISGNVSVLANEFNNTGETYKVTSTDFGIDTATDLAKGTASGATAAKSFKDNDANTTYTVTNNLETISPTGVVLRFAPYIFLLGAGFVLVMATRRRKEQEEA